eukprot:symbB.v1.2.024715.t1/scaffold2360.1/size81400/2
MALRISCGMTQNEFQVHKEASTCSAARGSGSSPRLTTMSSEAHPDSCATTAASEREARNKVQLAEALAEVGRLQERAKVANQERLRCLEATRQLKGSIRIMGRIRPPVQGEISSHVLQPLGAQQLQVLTEPRALLTERRSQRSAQFLPVVGGLDFFNRMRHSDQSPLNNAMDFIADSAIEALAGHKFQSAGYTWLDEKMDPFWTGVARQVPRWVSPNLISVVGGICCALAAPMTVIANYLRQSSWYFFAPALIFVYMTCDAVDGKHARNTKQSTPLGAVVDHGIDAFCAFTTGIAVTVTADPELKDPMLMLAFCMFHGAWFSAQWGELMLGSLDQRGITEGEFASMLVVALPGLLGPDARLQRLPSWFPVVGNQKVLEPVTIITAVLCAGVSLSFALRIASKVKASERLSATFPVLHLVLHTTAAMYLALGPLLHSHPLLTFSVVGMHAALLMTKMRFMATFRVPWPFLHLEMLPLLLTVTIDACCGRGVPLPCWYLVVLAEAILLWSMWQRLLQRICRALDVPFLREVPQRG